MTGIYLHVPFCAQKCPYCDFYSGQYSVDRAQRYVDAVCRNLRAYPAGLAVDSVYFGGGTPSLLSGAQIAQMLETLCTHFSFCDPEITLEANPRTMTPQKLAAWRKCGINRLSVGVQSFQDAALQILGRKHTAAQAADAVKRAADAGFSNLSLDLMIGLQMQTTELLEADLEQAVSLPITHLSAYLLKIEEGTPFAAQPPAMLSADEQADRYLQMHDFLADKGFLHYELSNYAKAGFESRHNCKYWNCEDYIGIGPAAHSCFGGKRYAVPRNFDAFCDAPAQPTEITDDAPCGEAERIMLALRLQNGIRFSDYPAISAQIQKNAKSLIPQYVLVSDDSLRLTPSGWLVSNSVILSLLRGIF